jgi:hypothetical protein
MTFKWINKQGVTSDSGFTLQRQDRFHYHYVEGDLRLIIDIEHLNNIKELSFTTGRWSPPHDHLPVSKSELDRIVTRIQLALEFMGTDFRWVDRETSDVEEPEA